MGLHVFCLGLDIVKGLFKMFCYKKEKKERKKDRGRGKKRYGKIAMNNYLSVITLNVNGLNSLIKRQRVAEWIRKQNKTHTYAVYKIST